MMTKIPNLKIATNTEIKIDKGIPMPASKPAAWPLAEMEVGDSFALDASRVVALRASIAYEKRKSGKKFAVKTLPHEVRCWRVA